MTGPEVVKVWIHPNQSLNQRAETKERLETSLEPSIGPDTLIARLRRNKFAQDESHLPFLLH